MDPLFNGPEHRPLRARPRIEPRRTYTAPRAVIGVPVPQAVVAVLAAAMAGAAAWLAGERHATLHAPLHFAVPMAPMALPAEAPQDSPPPLLERAVAAPESEATALSALPELPTAGEPPAPAPRA